MKNESVQFLRSSISESAWAEQGDGEGERDSEPTQKMKLENKLLELETKLREAAEARNITPPVRQAIRDAIDAIIKAQRELANKP